MTSHHTWGSVTTLHDFGGVLGWTLNTFFWAPAVIMVTALGPKPQNPILCTNMSPNVPFWVATRDDQVHCHWLEYKDDLNTIDVYFSPRSYLPCLGATAIWLRIGLWNTVISVRPMGSYSCRYLYKDVIFFFPCVLGPWNVGTIRSHHVTL